MSGMSEICMAVNISGHTFKHEKLIEVITDVLEETGIPHNVLDLEITEGIAIQNMQTTVSLLNKLHSLGIKITIDDFGTGFSSLNYLSKFPIQKLKIGMTFVQDSGENTTNRAIVTAIVALAKSLGLKVIAEGVETKDQFEFLRELKCDEIQGHFFGKAITGEEMGKFLKQDSFRQFASPE